MFLVDRKVVRRSVSERDRGGTRSVVMLLIIGSDFLAERKSDAEHEQLKSALDGVATTYAIELAAQGNENITLNTSSADAACEEIVQKQIAWIQTQQCGA